MTNVQCDYCGNTSGKEDSYGNCRSCGGKLTRKSSSQWADSWNHVNGVRDYTGVSGGFSTFGERGQEAFVPMSSVNASYHKNDYLPTISCFKGVPIHKIKVGTLLHEEWADYLESVEGVFYEDFHG